MGSPPWFGRPWFAVDERREGQGRMGVPGMSQAGSEPSSWIYPRLSPVDETADGLGARLDTRRAEPEIRERLRDWQGLLVRQTTEARDILRTFLVGATHLH